MTTNTPRVLVACEESQVVTQALRERGIDAWSCDVVETSGPRPDWHLQTDVLPLLREPWDAVLAFPPCTHLAGSGARWWPAKRRDGRQAEGVRFFMACIEANAPMVAVENPVGLMNTIYRKPDCIIQPWQHGHGVTKATCLWLKGLPVLEPSAIVDGRRPECHMTPGGRNQAKRRSKTYTGVAEAMADQWAPIIRGY